MKPIIPMLYRLLMLILLLVATLIFLFNTTLGLSTSIKLANLFLPGTLKITHTSGTLIKAFTFKQLTYIHQNTQITLTQGKINWKIPTPWDRKLHITRLSIDHAFILYQEKIPKSSKHTSTLPISAKTLKLPFPIQIDKITVDQLEIQNNKHTNHFKHLNLQGDLSEKHWRIQQLSIQTLTQQISFIGQGKISAPYSLSANLKLITIDHHVGINGLLNIHGDFSRLYWKGKFNGIANGHLSGTLKNGFEIQADLDWDHTTWPINTASKIQSSQGSLKISGNWVNLTLKSHATIESPIPVNWEIDAHIKHHLTTMKMVLHLPKGELQTTLIATLSLTNSQQGKLALTIQPGSYQLPPNSPIPSLPFKGGHLLASLTPNALNIKSFFTLDPTKTIDMNLVIPGFRLNQLPNKNTPMRGELKVNINSLAFLKELSPTLEDPQGQFVMRLSAHGTINKPILKGNLLLNHASVNLPSANLQINPIQISLISNKNHWRAQGFMSSSGQTLSLQGEGQFAPLLKGQLTLQANKFPLMKTAQYAIDLSPHLILNISPNILAIHGNILIPSATLKPLSFSDSINLSEDVIFVHHKTTTTPPLFNITTDVQLTMGKKVTLDVKGLRGRLDGSLHITQKINSPMTAIGELHILNGKYQAYAQDLTIERGQLLFTGGPIDNPAINIRATRKFKNTASTLGTLNQPFNFNSSSIDNLGLGNKTTVGVDITGRMNATKIKLFSIPSNLSQSDILSLLILGKPANQANKAGGQLLLAAVSSMNLDSGTKGMQLMDQLQQTLGIDVNLQNNTAYNQQTNQATDNTSLVVGKSLSKRIYVSYNIGLLQTDSNVLTLKYLLNKFFSIQVNASDSASGIDLMYTHAKH